MFNVDLLRPYFPPLLDTSKKEEQLKLIDINPDCMEQTSNDHIVDTRVKGTHQQKFHLYRVVKEGQLLHQGKWLTRGQIQQNFPHLMGELNAMDNIASLWGGLMQVDISGHPSLPTGSHTVFILAIVF
jgi:hypothetical protein